MIYILSFILDNYFTNSLFIFLSLLLTYNKKNKVYISALLGFLYDVIYTNTLFINTIIFLLSTFIIEKIHKEGYFNLLLNTLILIVYYRIIQFIVINISKNYLYSNLLINILDSLPINFLYVSLIFLIKKIHKFKFKHIIN